MEIKATDLRIGNWAQHQPHPYEQWQVTIELLSAIECGTLFVVGIPLTEELLLKMGFEKVYCSEYNWLFELTSDISFEYKFNFMENTQHLIWKSRVIPCLMVHDLQNIVWLLGKKELTLS